MDGRHRRYRERSLSDAGRSLERLAPLVRFGLMSVGVAVALDQVRPLVSDGQYTWGERRVIAFVTFVILAGFALASWVFGQLLRAGGALMEAVADGADAAERSARLIETQLVPRLDRAVVALERIASGPVDADASREADEIRRAIAEGRWTRAERLIEAFRRNRPQSLEATSLRSELDDVRRRETDELRERLETAMAEEDAGSAINQRDALTRLIGGDELVRLDQRLVTWLASWVRSRSRTGGMDVAAIAALAADRFGDTPEGRALRAAVPRLRRRARLCVSCARPYRGPGDACPDCLNKSAARPVPGQSRGNEGSP